MSSPPATRLQPDDTAKLRILVFSGTYIPYAPSGVLRTVANTVDRLGDGLDFTIVTRYLPEYESEGIRPNETRRVGHARVHYAAPERLGWMRIAELMNTFDHDVVWLNSCFTDFTIKPLLQRRLGRVPERPVVLAPHGELLPQALRLKRVKKWIYLAAARLAGLYDDIVWMATNRDEEKNIYRIFGRGAAVQVAQNIPDTRLLMEPAEQRKKAGELSVVFLSRISPIKNLDQALRLLAQVRDARITFDIYGPLQDEAYWNTCQELMESLPPNVTATYRGTLPYEEVGEALQQHDLFFLPTHSENYGYVILEALAARCPVLISDRTPWLDLGTRGAGWVAPLENERSFVEALTEAANMDEVAFEAYRQAAYQVAEERILDGAIAERVRELFLGAVTGP